MKKKTGLIISGVFLLSLVLVVGITMAVTFEEASAVATVTVNTFLSVTLSNAPVEFANMNPGQTLNATGGSGFPLIATIGAESNVNANVETAANQTTFGVPGTFQLRNIQW